MPDDTLLVSNVCGFASAGDGYLSLLDGRGNVIDWRIVDALDSPLGMTFSAGVIYVIDANRVRSFAWPGFTALDVISLDTEVANDITSSSDGVLYVSDTVAGRVMKVTPNGDSEELASDTQFTGANGVELAPNGDLFVGGERLWRVDLETGKVQVIGPSWLKDIDGIEFEAKGVIQVTPVGGPLVRVRRDGSAEVLGGGGISSANHGYAESLNLVLIPTGYDNTVIAIDLSQCDEEC
ncbi:MAG: hypothetical protein AAGA09_08765 [Pseudomonadota bacterium]